MIELPVEGGLVERGTPVTVTAIFSGDPEGGVFASFMRPQEGRAILDPGYGQEGSRIRRIGQGVYSYKISTRDCKQGRVTWHIWGGSDGDNEDASRYGWFEVKFDKPPQLL